MLRRASSEEEDGERMEERGERSKELKVNFKNERTDRPRPLQSRSKTLQAQFDTLWISCSSEDVDILQNPGRLSSRALRGGPTTDESEKEELS